MSNKTIVITGCSSGFGRCTALELAQRGWRVFATVRKAEDRVSLLDEARSRHCRENLEVLLCDITRPEEVSALAKQVEELLSNMVMGDEAASTMARPHLNALLNNAGTAYGGPIELLALEDLRRQFEINVFAHISVIQAFLPLLKAARGTIINVSSISGRISVPVTGVYSASKFALEGLSDALRLELAPFGVRVVLIEPASSPTSIWQTSLERSRAQIDRTGADSAYTRLLNAAEKNALRSSKKGFPVQRFAAVVVKILNTDHPRARYGVPTSATIIMLIRRLLPDAIWDRLIRRLLHW